MRARFFRLAAILLCPLAMFSQSEVCRREGISGFDAYAIRAHKFLPPGTTSDLSKIVVYVERTPTDLDLCIFAGHFP